MGGRRFIERPRTLSRRSPRTACTSAAALSGPSLQSELQAGENLAHLVVQLAGKGAPFRLVDVHEPPREALEAIVALPELRERRLGLGPRPTLPRERDIRSAGRTYRSDPGRPKVRRSAARSPGRRSPDSRK